MSAVLPWLTARDHLGVCIMAALIIGSVVAPLIVDAFRALDMWSAANVDHLMSAPDPVDAHFDSLPGWVAAPTFADLRADWPAWEREVSA